MQKSDVIVVGAGISGLVTAWWLQRRGLSVRVLEVCERPGGTIGTIRDDGFLFEAGPNSALDTTPLLAELIRDLGISDERVTANAAARNRYVLRGGRLIALPLSPPAFLRTPLFSLRAKLALLREPFVAPAPPEREESVAQFVRRRLGEEFLDYAVDPFVSGVYAGNTEQLSVRAAFPRLQALESRYGSLIGGQIRGARERARRGERSKQSAEMFSFRGGMQTLTDAIARGLPGLALGSEVIAIERDEPGRFVVTTKRSAGEIREAAGAVLVSTPAYSAADLVAPLVPDAAEALRAIRYPAVAVCASVYPRSAVTHPLDGFGFLVPTREKRRILGTIFSSTLFPGRAPEDRVLLTTFVGGARRPDTGAQTDSDIVATVQGELAELLGAAPAAERVHVTRWQRAIPQYELGHGGRMDRLEAAESREPGLFFCANYRGGVAMGDCIKSASAMAQRIAEFLGGSTK